MFDEFVYPVSLKTFFEEIIRQAIRLEISDHTHLSQKDQVLFHFFLDGFSTTDLIVKAAPPLVSPSSFVSTTPS